MNVPYVPSQNEDMTVEFQHLGIQCVRRKDIGEALKQREQIRVDPYRQGFDHMNSTQAVDLNAVRLCFQVIFGPAVIQVFVCSPNFLCRSSWKIPQALASIQSHFLPSVQNLYLTPRPRELFRYNQFFFGFES